LSPEPPPSEAAAKRAAGGRKFWISFGEVIAVLALAIAALNYWDSHRDHVKAARREALAEKAQTALVLRGVADAGGRKILLSAAKDAQTIQSQRFTFPSEVLPEVMEVRAARPQIDLVWFQTGLNHALDRAKVGGAGEAVLPVAVETVFVEDGETHIDRSLYDLGFAYRSRLLLGRALRLEGLALARSAIAAPTRALVDARWRAAHP
jgi:hypothetical protein